MISSNVFRQLAMSFPGVAEQPHFDNASFRINKKIFATLDEEKGQASIKLSPIDQNVFCAFNKDVIYPVSNKWGVQGWTIINLELVKKAMLKDALSIAYKLVAKNKLPTPK